MGKISLKTNAIYNIIYTLANMLLPMITYPYVSRVLLPDGMGKVSFFTNLSSFACMIAAMGVGTYGIRAVAKVRDSDEELSKTVKELLIINLINTMTVTIILVISCMFIGKFRIEYQLLIIQLMSICVAPIGMNWLFSGLEQYAYITKRNIIFKMISLICIFLLVREKQDYILYAMILAMSNIGSYICNYLYAKKFINLKIHIKLELKQHLKPMLILFGSALAVSIYTNMDTIMLGFISGDTQVGYYTIAVKIKGILLNIVNAISAVLLPRLSYYIVNDMKKEYCGTIKKAMSIIVMIALPFTILFMIEAKDCMWILGGEGFFPAVTCMQIIMPVLMISGFSNITGNQVLIPKGNDSAFMIAVSVGAFVDIVLNLLFMPKWGAVGATIATLSAECVQMLIQLYYAKEVIFLNYSSQSLAKICISSAISGIVIMVLLKTGMVYLLNPFARLIIMAALFFICYYFILVMVCREECIVELVDVLKKKVFRNGTN